MGQKNSNLPNPLIETQHGQMASAAMASGAPEGRPVAADRLYQLAALTAGIFLLVTLL